MSLSLSELQRFWKAWVGVLSLTHQLSSSLISLAGVSLSLRLKGKTVAKFGRRRLFKLCALNHFLFMSHSAASPDPGLQTLSSNSVTVQS